MTNNDKYNENNGHFKIIIKTKLLLLYISGRQYEARPPPRIREAASRPTGLSHVG